MRWFLNLKKKRSIADGFVAVHETSTGISMAYTIPGLLEGTTPVIKAHSFVPVVQQAKRQAVLAQFVAEHRLENLMCSYVVANENYNLILLEAPPVAKEEFANAAVWLIKDMLTFPTEDAVIDTFELPMHRARDNTKMIYAAVMRKDLIPKITDLICGAKLELTYIDIPELALRNIEKYCVKKNNGVVIFQLFPNGGKLVFCKENKIYLVRNIDLKLDELTVGEVIEVKLLEQLSLEIQRSFDYLSSLFRQSIGNTMIIVPTLINASIVKEYLVKALGIEIHLLNLSQCVIFKNEMDEPSQAENLLAVGGVLRATGDIEL